MWHKWKNNLDDEYNLQSDKDAMNSYRITLLTWQPYPLWDCHEILFNVSVYTKLQFSVAMVTVKDVTGAALRCLQDI